MALNTTEYCITCKKKTMHVNHICVEHTKKEISLRSALNQNLFNLMHDEHGLLLTQSEMEDIKVAIRKDEAEVQWKVK